MPRSRPASLSGWASFPTQAVHLFRPETGRDLAAILTSSSHRSFIARGLGRSYGDAALNQGEGVISMLRMNRFLSFEEETGTLECEAGASLSDIIHAFLPRGFFPPVVPGTRHVTVGGAVAADIHGKNQHVDGSFGDWTLRLEILTPDGESIVCSDEVEPEVFRATIGGMGLTGLITRAWIRLRRVPSELVRVRAARGENLHQVLESLRKADSRHPYTVAWLDCLAEGPRFGRGLVLRGDHVSNDARTSARPARSSTATVPFTMPLNLVRPRWVSAFNALWYRRQAGRGERLERLASFHFPLDAVNDWNRLYGRRGFLQYQALVPTPDDVVVLLERLRRARVPILLAVLKRLGGPGRGPLSFSAPGYTLTVDVPRSTEVVVLFHELDDFVAERGGRVYLAKDAVLSAGAFERMYPAAGQLRCVRRRVDPDQRISSSLSRRLGIDR